MQRRDEMGPGREVRMDVTGDVTLDGFLAVPEGARGIVLFAHGSGSGRHSPRNQAVARTLRDGGLGTLLFDLLTPEEELIDRRNAKLRFDIGLLAARLGAGAAWVERQPALNGLKIGYFGSSTGGAAALVAAADTPERCGAVVSRGGRPDLAGPALASVRSPTLLVVGGHDEPVLDLNRQALAQLRCEKRLEVVPGATHLFEEPGTLERVSALATDWFQKFLR